MSVTLKILSERAEIYGLNGTLEGSFMHDLPPKGVIYRKRVQRGWSVYGPSWEVHHVAGIMIEGEDMDGVEGKDL